MTNPDPLREAAEAWRNALRKRDEEAMFVWASKMVHLVEAGEEPEPQHHTLDTTCPICRYWFDHIAPADTTHLAAGENLALCGAEIADVCPSCTAAQQCVWVPAHEPWSCATHVGGMRTSLDDMVCRVVSRAKLGPRGTPQ